MSAEIIAMNFRALLDPIKRNRLVQEARVRRLFRDREHARQVWDDWDGISHDEPNGEDAHLYLNLIGDGAYCAV